MDHPTLKTKLFLGLLGVGVLLVPLFFSSISNRLFNSIRPESTSPSEIADQSSAGQVESEVQVVPFQTIDRETLKSVVGDGGILIIDLRSETEYKDAHIPNAISLPIDDIFYFAQRNQLEALAEEFGSRRIVLYCSKNCPELEKAASLLSKIGVQAFVFTEGFEDWTKAGLEVER